MEQNITQISTYMKKSMTIRFILKIRYAPVFLVVMFVCACVSLKTPKRANLVALKAPMLIGRYPVSYSKYLRSKFHKDTVMPVMIWYFFKDSPGKDSAELAQASHMELNLTDKKHMISKLYNGNILLKTETIKGHLRRGYFRKKHDLSFTGVPPFYWSMTSIKKQFGLGTDNQLFIDAADETSGSVLIFGASSGGCTTSHTIMPVK